MDSLIFCGVCGGAMEADEENFCCKKCGLFTDRGYISGFLTPKYTGKIKKIIIENKHSARIYFKY